MKILERLYQLIAAHRNLWLPPIFIVFVLFSIIVVYETDSPGNGESPFSYRMF
ncbi:MAG: DUF5989 family protein [Nitrospirota bacterium]